MEISKIYSGILDELKKAEESHGDWSNDILHGLAILQEEVGELAQASVDFHYGTKCEDDISQVKKEALQSGAMIFRFLIALEKYQRKVYRD